MALCYGATGIACAAYAAAWGKPPEPCEGDPSACDVAPLTATNALSTVRDTNVLHRAAYTRYIGLCALFTALLLQTSEI